MKLTTSAMVSPSYVHPPVIFEVVRFNFMACESTEVNPEGDLSPEETDRLCQEEDQKQRAAPPVVVARFTTQKEAQEEAAKLFWEAEAGVREEALGCRHGYPDELRLAFFTAPASTLLWEVSWGVRVVRLGDKNY